MFEVLLILWVILIFQVVVIIFGLIFFFEVTTFSKMKTSSFKKLYPARAYTIFVVLVLDTTELNIHNTAYTLSHILVALQYTNILHEV